MRNPAESGKEKSANRLADFSLRYATFEMTYNSLNTYAGLTTGFFVFVALAGLLLPNEP